MELQQAVPTLITALKIISRQNLLSLLLCRSPHPSPLKHTLPGCFLPWAGAPT